jgi:hypothetical protein
MTNTEIKNMLSRIGRELMEEQGGYTMGDLEVAVISEYSEEVWSRAHELLRREGQALQALMDSVSLEWQWNRR